MSHFEEFQIWILVPERSHLSSSQRPQEGPTTDEHNEVDRNQKKKKHRKQNKNNTKDGWMDGWMCT